jgi:hypothetical protein
MDEFDGDSLLRYDVAHGWRSLPALHMSMLLHHTQGASVRGGFIWICTSDDHNDLFRVSLATGHVDNIGRLGHPGGEGEGIDVTPLASGYLHAMIIDPGLTNVWVEHFDLVAASASPAPTATPTPTSPPSIVANNGTGLANTGPPSAVAPLGLVVAGSATVLWWLRRRCSEKPTSRRPLATRRDTCRVRLVRCRERPVIERHRPDRYRPPGPSPPSHCDSVSYGPCAGLRQPP